MSQYSMSPPQKPAPRPYSPAAYQPAASPTNYGAQPPAKRQRLSPDPRSPSNGPPQYTGGLPLSYGNPYAPQAQAPVQPPYGSPSYANSPQGAFNTPQYHPQWQSQPPTPAPAAPRQTSPPQQPSQTSAQMMPPPPRPNKDEKEERMNIDDIGDSLYGAGVSIKDEEAFLHSQFNNQHTAIGNSFSSNQSGGGGTSFGSSTMSPNGSFNLLTQGTSFGDSQRNGALAGTLGQREPQEQIEEAAKLKRDQAARERNERWQHHMNNQFLQTNAVRARLDTIAKNQGVAPDLRGLYQRQDLQGQSRTTVMMNGDGTTGIAAVDTRPEFTAGKGEPFEQMMCLISLAGGERLRGLMDEAFALSRARRYGDHGRVPPEFADIAVANGERRQEEVIPEAITGSQWDKVPSSEDAEMVNGIDGPTSTTPQPKSTVSFSSAVALKLRDLAKTDRLAEDARVRKREARRRAAAEKATDANDSAAEGSAPENSSAPTPSAAAADVPKLSKKEQARKEKEAKNATDAHSHTTTNQTAAMMAMGKKGTRYSWMTGGASAASALQNRYKASAPASGTATPNAGGGAGAGGVKSEAASPSAAAMARGGSEQGVKLVEWGDWREEGGIQARDWMAVLERDGKQGKALQRLSLKLT